MPDPDKPSTVGMLTRKVGPLAAYQWAIVIVGVGVVIWWWRKRNGEINAGISGSPVTSDDLSAAGSAADISGIAEPPAPTQAPITDVETWTRFAGNYLVSQGYDPVGVSTALRKYISGEGGPPTAQERAWVNIAIQKFGIPPGGAIGWQPVPTPTPTPTPTPKPGVMGPAVRSWDSNNPRVASSRVTTRSSWEHLVKIWYKNLGTDPARIARVAGNLRAFNAGHGGYKWEIVTPGSKVLVPQKLNG